MPKPSARPGSQPRQEPTGPSPESSALDPPPPSVAGAVRGAIDSLVQGSLVELFQAYSVALAPQARSARDTLPKLPEICACIGFSHGSASKRSGKLTLCLSSAIVSLMKVELASSTRQLDWARELCNQLMGRIKNRMLQFNVRIQAGLPATVEAAQLEEQLRSSPAARVYSGRTLRGDVLVFLDGLPHESELVYVGLSHVASEGEAIFF